MSHRLTNMGITDWLEDFSKNSKTTIIESGRAKEEIIAIAEAKGINLKHNSDLAGFKTVYTFANKANGNRTRVPKKLLLKALPTIVGKPVNIDHIRNYVVGYYIDYRYNIKEDKVIAYGIFFKSNFGHEWEEAKSLLKSGMLATSHEIWCPKDKRRYLSDGTYELMEVEIAGGALMYKEKPAHKNCNVLEIAKQLFENKSEDLIFASLEHKPKDYLRDDLIFASDAEEFRQNNIEEIERKVAEGVQAPVPEPVPTPVQKLKCTNCEHEFEPIENANIKCPECFAILDSTGTMIYPPQHMNFNISCPSCKMNEWRLVKDEGEKAQVKCLSCAKNYEFKFKQAEDNQFLKGMNFVYVGSAECLQCRQSLPFSTVSGVKVKVMTCEKCGLKQEVDVAKAGQSRQIATFAEIEEKAVKNTTEGGDTPMEDKTKELHVSGEVIKEVTLETASMVTVSKEKELYSASEVPKAVKSVDLVKASQDTDNKYRTLLRKAVKKIVELKKSINLDTASLKSDSELEIAKIREESDKKIKFYKENASEILSRRTKLGGTFSKDLSDKDILDNDKFEKAQLELEVANLRSDRENSSDVVGDKTTTMDGDALRKQREAIDNEAFGRNK